jgi:hypothetical protein
MGKKARKNRHKSKKKVKKKQGKGVQELRSLDACLPAMVASTFAYLHSAGALTVPDIKKM